jgi:prevent-host-death family protein
MMFPDGLNPTKGNRFQGAQNMAEEKRAREAAEVYSVDLSNVELGERPVIIEREGEPVAAVVPIDEYRRFSVWREERATRRLWVVERDPRSGMPAAAWRANFEAMDRFAAYFDDATPEQLEADLDEATASVRAHRSEAGEPDQ